MVYNINNRYCDIMSLIQSWCKSGMILLDFLLLFVLNCERLHLKTRKKNIELLINTIHVQSYFHGDHHCLVLMQNFNTYQYLVHKNYIQYNLTLISLTTWSQYSCQEAKPNSNENIHNIFTSCQSFKLSRFARKEGSSGWEIGQNPELIHTVLSLRA